MTGARDSAIASLRLKHVDLVDRCVMQDGREVHTKNGKTIMTWFFPVDPMYHACFEAWVTYLRQDCLRGPSDALFPKQMVGTRNGQFAALGLSAECYGNGQPINTVVKGAFVAAGMRAFNAHSLRKTLAMLGDKVCESMEQRKSWSMNLGHEHLATTINSYLPVSIERQGELIKKMSDAIEVGALR